MTRAARLAAAVLAAVLAVAIGAGAARADGDPASDFLVAQKVFLPYDAKIPAAKQSSLTALVDEAAKQGYPIRVALIWSSYDLGSVTALWNRPRTYAHFLAVELSYYFKGPLLIVMPKGYGFYWLHHGSAKEYAQLAKLPIAPTPAGLADAGIAAVTKLAAAAGVDLGTPAPTSAAPQAQRNSHDRVVIVAAVVVALLLGWLFRFVVRRRASG